MRQDDTPRFFIYARKSKKEDKPEVKSIKDQIAEMNDLAGRGLVVVDVLAENKSAKIPGRPVFNDMLRRIARGEANGILAWHPDRIARNMLDGGHVIHLLDSGKIKHLKFATFWFDNTAQGKLNLGIQFGMSKYYVDKLSDDIIRGQRQKAKEGIWPMVAPVGYLNDHQTKLIYPDPDRSHFILKCYELYGSGTFTIDRLRETVDGLGFDRKGKRFCRSQYHRILENPLYCGIINYGNETYEGKHMPIVSRDLLDQVQKVMKGNTNPKGVGLKPYLYRGMFRCGECGCMVTSETQKGHNYVHCTKRVKKNCSQPYLREENVASQVSKVLSRITIPDDGLPRYSMSLSGSMRTHKQSATTPGVSSKPGSTAAMKSSRHFWTSTLAKN